MWCYCWDNDLAGELGADPEGITVWLCEECAADLGEVVSPAGTDDLEQVCWRCGRWPEPEEVIDLDRYPY